MSATKYFDITARIDQAVLKLVTLEAVATMEHNTTSSELMACVVARSELMQLVNEFRAELMRDAGIVSDVICDACGNNMSHVTWCNCREIEMVDEEYEDYEDDYEPDVICPRCHGAGIWDGPEPCDHCDGMGYEWWW